MKTEREYRLLTEGDYAANGRITKDVTTMGDAAVKDDCAAVKDDCGKESGILNMFSNCDIAMDIKVILSDYYTATFTNENANKLKLCFNNGQTIYITVSSEE